MTDLLKLADFMEEQSHTSGDHHMQAAEALKKLQQLEEQVHPDILEATAKLRDYWYEDCGRHPYAAEHMAKLEELLDKVESCVESL